MHLVKTLTAAGLLVSLAAPCVAQDLEFEQVGDQPIDAAQLQFDPEETLWAVSIAALWRSEFLQTWEEVGSGFGNYLLVLSPDTLFRGTNGGTHRSLDGGMSFVPVHSEGGALFAADVGGPNSGVILVASSPGSGIAYSTDRGASFTEATFTVSTGSTPFMEDAVEILDGPSAGRLVAGVFGGVVISEDAGRTWSPSSLFQDARFWVQRVEIGTDPNTGNRRLHVTLADAALPDVQFYVSDDDGLTWTNIPGMVDAYLFVYVPQGEGYLLAVERATALEGDRLTLWRSDDAGQLWGEVGELPAETEGHTAHLISTDDMLIGPDGRVYVAVSRAGPEREWVYRTTEPVVVAGEPEIPPAPTAERLVVYPNPATGRITVQGVEPGEEIVLYDVLGRAVLRSRAPTDMDVSALPPGVYVLRVGRESRAVTVRR